MRRDTKAQIIATLIEANRPDLANLVANPETVAKPPHPDVQEAYEEYQAAKDMGYPRSTTLNLWKDFLQLAKKYRVDPGMFRQ